MSKGKPGDDERPIIIIRRKKVVHGGHHGGAWKIAYADFMTAMMALFLVLWLLAQSDQSELEGIAEYFNTPLKVALAGGKQPSMSSSIIPGGGSDPLEIEGQQVRIDNRQATRPAEVQRTFFELIKKIRALMEADPALREMMSQVRFELIDEGLLIEFIDSRSRPMFDRGSDELAPYMEKLLVLIAPLLDEVSHLVTITGHTDSTKFSAGERNYSNWELSTDRANASRRALMVGGMRMSLMNRIVGLADRAPVVADHRNDPRNRRIALLVHGDLKILPSGVKATPVATAATKD